MELIRISANKVRVILSKSELEALGIEVPEESADYYCVSKRSAKRILEAVKKATGVDYCGERAFIRVFGGTAEGCELEISRAEMYDTAKKTCRVRRFQSAEALIEACKRAQNETTDAYASANGFFLVFYGGDGACGGDSADFPYCEEYVREHCRLIAKKNAAKRLSRL